MIFFILQTQRVRTYDTQKKNVKNIFILKKKSQTIPGVTYYNT